MGIGSLREEVDAINNKREELLDLGFENSSHRYMDEEDDDLPFS